MDKYLNQINLINDKVDLDSEFPDWDKKVQFIIDDERGFYFITKDGEVAKVEEGFLPDADVTLRAKEEAFDRMFAGDLAVIGGWITQEIVIEGKVGDAVGANVLIQAARMF